MQQRPRTFLTTLEMLATKDRYAAAHAEEVAELAEGVGVRLGFRGAALRALRYAALLHDAGNLGVSPTVLNKRGSLTGDEYEEMQTHAVVGAEIVAGIPFFERVAPVVRAVHERWDGVCYPDGLAGEAIPLAARIVGACDGYLAMTAHRPYRTALPACAARLELAVEAGAHFDPVVV